MQTENLPGKYGRTIVRLGYSQITFGFPVMITTGGREVSEPVSEVSRPDIGLHDGLVPAVAEGRADRRLVALPRSVQHRQRGRDEAPAHRDDGHRT